MGTYIAQQRWDEALTVAQGIEDASQRDRSYLNIAQQLIEAQRWDQVYVVATAIGYDQGRIDLVCALAQLQQWEAANTIIELLKSSWARGEALLQVGSQLAAAGLHAEAQQSFDAARSSLKIAAGSQLTRWHALAAALLRAEKTDEAHQVFNLAHKIAEAAPDPITREWNLVHHVKALINSGLWDEARAIAQTIADPDKQAQIRAACALVLVNEQRWDEAHTLLIGQDHPISLSHTLLQIGALHQQAGHTAEAERFFITAHAAAGLIEREEDRDDALRDLISALIKDGRWDEAMYIADDVTDSGKRVMARAEVARGLAQNQSWHEARMLIDTLEESYARAWALEGYASALAAAGRWEELRALTAEALLAAETREDTLRLIVLPLAFAPLDPELPSRLHAALLEVEDQRS